jgi:hypothetical protein
MLMMTASGTHAYVSLEHSSEANEVYLTSFIHREGLFNIAERWFCGRLDPGDARALTEILICDGFVISETLQTLAERLLEVIYPKPFRHRHISFKGELRDLICLDNRNSSSRVAELFARYRENPDYYYRGAPINAVMYLDERDRMLGIFRIKRPKRIAEKANRKIANWIFGNVLDKAQEMAATRARLQGVRLEEFITPPEEMVREFVRAEESIAWSFRDGSIRFERAPLTIHDVGAMKIVGEPGKLQELQTALLDFPGISIVERESFSGYYQATNIVLKIPWNAEYICRKYRENKSWRRYLDRGIPPEELKQGLEPFLVDVEPDINVELILSTFPDMVESEFGNSIHEERIISQRDTRVYSGYIPMNVEFLVEYIFAVGFSPKISIDRVPIKLWGRYLPETLGSYIRQLYGMPERDLFY